MMTLLIILFPFITGLILFGLKNEKFVIRFAIAASIVETIFASYLLYRFIPEGGIQFAMQEYWISPINVLFNIGIDGNGMVMVLLTVILIPIIIMASAIRSYRNPGAFYGLIMIMQSALIGVFTSFNAILFYVFWELSLIPVYFIILIWGGDDRKKITLKFFIYTLCGNLFMLFAFIILYFQTPGAHSWDISSLYHLSLNSETQRWLFWPMFLGFAVKIPMFPFHTWLPGTYSSAPAGGSMLLAGIMSKMGIFGIIRWLLPVLPEGVATWQNFVLILAISGTIYGSVIAFRQNDLKKIIAYSSLAHTGLMAAGVFTANILSLQGSLFQVFAHGVYVTGLFLTVDIIETRLKTRDIVRLGDIKVKAPVLAGFFMIIILAAIGLPITNGFTGELLVITGIFKFQPWFAAIAGLSIILGAVYLLSLYQKVMLGKENSFTRDFKEIGIREKFIFLLISFIIIVTGVYPNIILQISEYFMTQLSCLNC
jgi:NADH-quinone oxidoreductase subunit M